MTLQLDIQQLDRERIAAIGDWSTRKGENLDGRTFSDANEKIKLTLPSAKQKVAVSKELLDELDAQALPFKLN